MKQKNANTGIALIVIGTSKGGMNALKQVLSGLPPGFDIPIAVALHRGKDSGAELGGHIEKFSPIPVREAEDKAPIVPGHIFLAPADYHLLVENEHFALSTEAPMNFARPSIDALFESAADVYGRGVMAIILTGSGDDGAKGIAAVKKCGGTAVVQDPKTAESRDMPEAAMAAVRVDYILPLEAIGPFLAKMIT